MKSKPIGIGVVFILFRIWRLFFQVLALCFWGCWNYYHPMWKLKGKPFSPRLVLVLPVEVFCSNPMALDESRCGTQDFTPFFVEMIFRPFGDGQMSYPFRIPWKLLLIVSWLTSPGILAHVFTWILNDAFWRWVFSPYCIRDCRVYPGLNFNELMGPQNDWPYLKPESDTSSKNHHFWYLFVKFRGEI